MTSLAALALVAVPVLSACDTGPGAAAIIGGKQITTQSLQDQVNESLAGGEVQKSNGYSGPAFTRELLTHLVGVVIVNRLAADHHVTLTPQDISTQTAAFVQQAGGSVTALHQQAAQGGVTVAQLPGFIRYAALQEKVGNALAASLPATQAQLEAEYQKDIDTYDQLDIAQIVVASKPLAQKILKQVKAKPSLFASLAAKDSTDATSKAKGGAVGFVGRSQVVSLLGGDAAKAKPGAYTLAASSNQFVVLHIISRRTTPLSQVKPQVKTALNSAQANNLLTKAISAEASKLGVHINPRYGTWNGQTQTVVALKSSVSSAG